MSGEQWLALVSSIGAAVISATAALYASRAERNSRPVDQLREDMREVRQLLSQHLVEHGKR